MQKKSNQTSLLLSQPIKVTRDETLRKGELQQLFGSPYSECFELEYLRHSPHMQTCLPYRELVSMLQHYNDDTANGIKRNNRVQAASMRLIFREMLSIAVMQQRELQQNDFASKLQKWYYGLNEHHSFLQGVAFFKKKNREDEAKLQQLIRQSYVSNVYDEIEDYLRKQAAYPESQQENQIPTSHTVLSLPYIDCQLYKRQEAYMREHREKCMERQYLNTMLTNKNRLREASLNRLRPIVRNKAALTEHRPPLSPGSQWQRGDGNRLSLININGINLIHSRFE